MDVKVAPSPHKPVGQFPEGPHLPPFSYILHPPLSQYPLSDIDLLQAISIPFDDPKHVYFAEVLFKNLKEKVITTKASRAPMVSQLLVCELVPTSAPPTPCSCQGDPGQFWARHHLL